MARPMMDQAVCTEVLAVCNEAHVRALAPNIRGTLPLAQSSIT